MECFVRITVTTPVKPFLAFADIRLVSGRGRVKVEGATSHAVSTSGIHQNLERWLRLSKTPCSQSLNKTAQSESLHVAFMWLRKVRLNVKLPEECEMTISESSKTGLMATTSDQSAAELAKQNDVWNRLMLWHPDEPDCPCAFSDRLQHENGWTRAYTRKAIAEYRKFLFLSQVADHIVCPSEDVDQVWHLHLTYTRSYWDELCGKILRRPLHHQPTRGGQSEQELYADLYRRTLSSYEHWFGCTPDPQLWPEPSKRFARKEFQRVDRVRYLLVRRPSLQLPNWLVGILNRLREILEWPRTTKAAGLVLMLTPAVIPIGPLDWTGPDFLKWYSGVLIGGIIAAFLLRHILWPDDADVPEDLRYYEVACLKGNWKLAVNSVLAKFLAYKDVVADVHATETRFRMSDSTRKGDDEFENSVARSLEDSAGLTMTKLHNELQSPGEQLEESLRKRGLLTGNASYALAARAFSFLIMLAVSGVGIAKVNVGVSRGKPVGFLVAMLIIPSLLGIWFLIRPRLTATSRGWLRNQVRERAGLKDDVGAAFRTPDNIALGTALFGAAALVGTELLPLKTAWQANRVELGASGCGTAGCGGGGCGGGGGGGCGGCGGGGD